MGLDAKLILTKKECKKIQSKEDIVLQFYFRKVNCLHGFIERSVGDDVELNCSVTKIAADEIRDLYRIVQKILSEKDEETIELYLPPTPGFFFGSTTVDDDYFECVKEIKEALDEIIPQLEQCTVYYWCWW